MNKKNNKTINHIKNTCYKKLVDGPFLFNTSLKIYMTWQKKTKSPSLKQMWKFITLKTIYFKNLSVFCLFHNGILTKYKCRDLPYPSLSVTSYVALKDKQRLFVCFSFAYDYENIFMKRMVINGINKTTLKTVIEYFEIMLNKVYSQGFYC